MTNAQWVFDRAIDLMDEGDPVTGARDTGATLGYKNRTLGLLNVLGRECANYSQLEEGWRELLDLEEELPLEEFLAQGVLPYGLAAQLLREEDPAAANFFQQRYEELLERWRRGRGAEFERLEPPYNGIELGQFGRWR